MNVDVDKLKDSFINKMGDLLNQDVYFVESCYKFPSKYSLEHAAMDEDLHIFFEENNLIILNGECLKYCTVGTKRKIKLLNISNEVESPDVNIVHNYVIEDKWKQIDW